MKITDIGMPKGANKRTKRRGRGMGSGHGKTACKGHKGSLARTGHHGGPRVGFEGGQMPLIRRVPKHGFTSKFKTYFEVVNVEVLNRFKENSVVTPEELAKENIIKNKSLSVKILGDGEITRPLTVRAHSFSKSSIEKIKKAGGTIELLAK
ncbi:MAG: 50S ribosomal protein L15 [Candidatus Omnitrophica bacterium]|nr:50S ribosomal protein L15 [Candidatus Omnitrophota bacterium]